MKLLSQSTIKQTELDLMSREGESLMLLEVQPQFAGFQPFTEKSQLRPLRKLAVAEAKTLPASPRAPYQAFGWMLLTSIFSNSLKQDVLCILKSTIYNQDCDHFQLDPENPKSISPLALDQTKKLMVNFFYELEYSQMENKVEEKLQKNGIIMDVMVSVLRRIAGTVQISNVIGCEISPSMRQVYEELINYFDLNCKIEGSLFLFYEDDLFVLETEKGNIVFGEYHKQSSKKNQMKGSKMRSSGGGKREEGDYRSLGIQGISDSVIMEVDADTPSFNFQGSQTSFRSSMASEESSLKNSRDSLKPHLASQSLMKANDLKKQMKQSQGLFGSSRVDNRQFLQQKLSKGLEPQGGFLKIMDSPQTASHTPKTIMHGSLCFQARLEPEMKRSDFCCLKKSQSVKDLGIDCKQSKECQQITQSCSCFEEKIQKNRICSNLYDISIRIVTEGKERFLSNRDIMAYVTTKGVNMEIFCKSPFGFNRSAKPGKGFPQPKIPSKPFPMKNKLSHSNSFNNLDTFRVPNSPKKDQISSQLSVYSTLKTKSIVHPSPSPVFLKKKQVPTLRLS